MSETIKYSSRNINVRTSVQIDNILDCDELESVTYFDKYGCEIDIRNKTNSKSNAILSIIDIFSRKVMIYKANDKKPII